MDKDRPNIDLRTSPHLRDAPSVPTIMRNVVYALLPICAFAIYQFGISALALIIVTTLSCILTESFFNRGSGKPDTVGDYSAMITGILMALTMPPGFPLWMAVVAAFIGVSLGKVFFGGLGFNVMNPALIGRAFVQAAFPVAITTWTPGGLSNRFVEFIPSTLTLPFMEPAPIMDWIKQTAVDGFSGATPLALWKFEQTHTDPMALLWGMTSGSAGETSALLILLCGIYLILRRMMDWRIPVSMLGMATFTGGFFFLMDPTAYPDPLFILFSGGLMLGAMFMASDMVASPVTPMGVWLYGGLMGFVTVIIRLFGGLPEGVMYAILLGNAVSPLIDSITQPRVYGTGKEGLPHE